MTRRLGGRSANERPVFRLMTNERAAQLWPELRTLIRDMLRLLEAAKLSQITLAVSRATDQAITSNSLHYFNWSVE